MFNKELKQQIQELKKETSARREMLVKANSDIKEKDAEIKRLQAFDKVIDEKLKELLAAKVDNYLLSIVSNNLCVSNAAFSSFVTANNKQHDSLQALLDSQAKELEILKQRDEDNKRILFLSGKVEQLLNKLNKK